jgi:hypothetical protein
MKRLNNFVYKFSERNRQRKYEYFISIMKPDKCMHILDVGPTDIEYSPFDNFLEKNYPFVLNITALGMRSLTKFQERYPDVKAVIYDGKRFPFRDGSFDIIWSNAVLEHVGSELKQIEFIKEIRRCGQKAFITTPNLLFPIEVHTRIPILHWLPKYHFDIILKLVGKPWATGNYMNLLSYKKIKSLLSKAGINEFIIKGNLIGPFTLDFMIIY